MLHFPASAVLYSVLCPFTQTCNGCYSFSSAMASKKALTTNAKAKVSKRIKKPCSQSKDFLLPPTLPLSSISKHKLSLTYFFERSFQET